MGWREGEAVTIEDFRRAEHAQRELMRDRGEAAGLEAAERREWEAALLHVAGRLRPLPEPLVLEPATWRASCRSATMGRCGRCPLCQHEASIERAAFMLPEEDGSRVVRRFAFDGLAEALEAYVAWREDAPGARSALGPMLERLRDGLGHGGGSTSSEDRTTRIASLMLDVEAGLLAGAGVHDTLDRRDVLAGLGLTLVGRQVKRGRVAVEPDDLAERWGVSLREARSTLRRARRRCRVELAARWLIPAGRDLRDEVEQVRAELLRGRR